jgi:hypothetical protein
MKKVLSIVLLLLVILITFSFAILKYSAQGSEDSFFNRHLRASFAIHPTLRQIFSLHFDGDGRADYLSARYQKIVVEVDIMADLEIRQAALDLFAQRVESITGKPTQIVVSETDLPFVADVGRTQIAELTAAHRTHFSGGDTAALYLLLVSRFQDEPQLLGQTFEDYGIVLFDQALADFSRINPDVLSSYEASTALHEFGHQLGLGHNTLPKCLMNEKAETGQAAWESPEDVVTDFCQSEKAQIQETINQLNN